MYRGGVRSFKKKFEDETEETFYYKARTPAENAGARSAISAFPQDEKGGKARDEYLAKFIADAMCDEAGTAVLTQEQARNISDQTKFEIAFLIIAGSSETGDAGKD